MTIGWRLDRDQRATLLARYPARYANPIADHVTLSVKGSAPPPLVSTAEIVGHIDDGIGVEAMVVAIDGSTGRPDGKIWHITWSLADARAPRESNDVIAQFGWDPRHREPLVLIPAFW